MHKILIVLEQRTVGISYLVEDPYIAHRSFLLLAMNTRVAQFFMDQVPVLYDTVLRQQWFYLFPGDFPSVQF